MKFTTLLTLLPLVSVAVAVPNPAGDSCYTQYCTALGDEFSHCAMKYLDAASQISSSKEYLRCFCSAKNKNNYKKCLECHSDSGSTYTSKYDFDTVCKGYKGAAISDKTCSWRMLGFAVAGGLAAVM